MKLPHSIIRIFLNYYSPQGNEDFRLMVDQHEEVAQEAATRIDELEEERNSYFTNAVELTSRFREMQEKYKHPREVNLASLEALKERLATKPGGPASKPSITKPPKTAIQGISPNNFMQAHPGSSTGPRSSQEQVPRTHTNSLAAGLPNCLRRVTLLSKNNLFIRTS